MQQWVQVNLPAEAGGEALPDWLGHEVGLGDSASLALSLGRL